MSKHYISEAPYKKFNRLCPCPAESIKLPDGRILDILEWKPEGTIDDEGIYGIPVTVKGSHKGWMQ
jgi:hypothetical protein